MAGVVLPLLALLAACTACTGLHPMGMGGRVGLVPVPLPEQEAGGEDSTSWDAEGLKIGHFISTGKSRYYNTR